MTSSSRIRSDDFLSLCQQILYGYNRYFSVTPRQSLTDSANPEKKKWMDFLFDNQHFYWHNDRLKIIILESPLGLFVFSLKSPVSEQNKSTQNSVPKSGRCLRIFDGPWRASIWVRFSSASCNLRGRSRKGGEINTGVGFIWKGEEDE
jgi:hypothetical protein